MLDLLTMKAEMVSAPALPEPVCDDPDDDKFLSCAIAAECKVIVSGDKHLLKVSGYRGVRVMKPREFMETYPGEVGKS